MQAIIGRKTEQKQAFLTDGTRIPLTVVAVPDMPVLAVKTTSKEGYTAVQVGFGAKKKGTKAMLGHVKKANLAVVPQMIKEISIADEGSLPTVGDIITAESVLKAGDIVKVTGFSKGKGFAGVVKRHNFRGGPRTHGQSDRERAPGSIGQTTTPGRVYRGKRMAGHMGAEVVSVTNLLVMDVVSRGGQKVLFLKGLVPGGMNSIITIEKTGQLSEKKFVPMISVAEPEVVEEIVAETEGEEAAKGEEVSESQADVAADAIASDTGEETKTSGEQQNIEEKEAVKEEK